MALEYTEKGIYEDGKPLDTPMMCKSFGAGCVRINLTTTHMYITLKRIIDAHEQCSDLYEPNELADEMHTLAERAINHIDRYGKE